MRIIGGRLGGLQFQSSKGKRTHPMSDKMRGALFNVLGDISDLTILDAFAGTGALSYEAISRGVKHVTAVEVDHGAQKIITANIVNLGLDDSLRLIKANVAAWSANNPTQLFDLIICDPPYDQLQISLIQKLVKHLLPTGVLILSWPGYLTPPELFGLNIVEQRNYGDSKLVFYRETT